MQLKAAKKNYPIHEKELLTLIRALKKWRADLLGSPIYVYTDHKTLENFDTQKDLSRRQLRWQEFLSQYNIQMTYICGEDNTVVDALSRVPPNSFPNETVKNSPMSSPPLTAVLSITTDPQLLEHIIQGYSNDEFCKHLPSSGMKSLQHHAGLWYLKEHLIIPHEGTICKQLFWLAHDTLGHFGADKSYAALHGAYYWPNMHWDLEQAYIPSCPNCQHNKTAITKLVRPLHPLPIPDARGNSVAIDFISPLPKDQGFDCIISMMDHLNCNFQIVPGHLNMTANELAQVFFNHWYCENGLPLNIVSDCDKLFVSQFW